MGWTGGVKGGSGEDGKRKTTFSGPVSVADRYFILFLFFFIFFLFYFF